MSYTIISIGTTPHDLEYQHHFPEGIIYADKDYANAIARRLSITYTVTPYKETGAKTYKTSKTSKPSLKK